MQTCVCSIMKAFALRAYCINYGDETGPNYDWKFITTLCFSAAIRRLKRGDSKIKVY